MNTIIKITLIIFLSITSLNNFVFSQDIVRSNGKGLSADFIPVYVNGYTKFLRKGMPQNCFKGSALDMSLPGCQEHIIYNPPRCGSDFYSCDEGTVSNRLKDDDKRAIWQCVKGADVDHCTKNKEQNDETEDFCGSSVGSCLSGSVLTAQNSMTNSWTCKKTYDEIESKTQNCQKVVLPSVDGSCGMNKYECNSGTSDIVSSTTWICRGSNGGSDQSCSYEPVIDGVCGSAKNSCDEGTYQAGFGDNWTCKGSNGGTSENCSGGGFGQPADGVCGSDLYTCEKGSVILKNGNDWGCSGVDGGSNDYCTYEDPNSQNCSGGMVDMSIIKDGECMIYSSELNNGESQKIGSYETNKPYGVCGKCDFNGQGSEIRYYTLPEVKCDNGQFKVVSFPNKGCVNPN